MSPDEVDVRKMTSETRLREVTIGEPEEGSAIVLQEYDPAWPQMFDCERGKICAVLDEAARAVEHVGSTSVPGLCAKPILDILLLVADPEDEDAYVPVLERIGYRLRVREPDWYEHRMLKGTDPVVNLHVFAQGCEEAERMLRFRDWLRAHDADRDRYANEKRRLAAMSWRFIQDYADAKSDVVADIMRRAASEATRLDPAPTCRLAPTCRQLVATVRASCRA